MTKFIKNVWSQGYNGWNIRAPEVGIKGLCWYSILGLHVCGSSKNHSNDTTDVWGKDAKPAKMRQLFKWYKWVNGCDSLNDWNSAT